MEYRCLFKASLEKLYTSIYYQKKKNHCVKFLSLATLQVRVGFGLVGVK